MGRYAFNLCHLKATPHQLPYILDDTVVSVHRLLQRAGLETSTSLNRIDPTRINILFGVQMPNTPPIPEIRRVVRGQRVVIFNTEQLGGESSWITGDYLDLLSEFATLDYNIENIRQLLKVRPHARAVEFPLVPDDRFIADIGYGGALPQIRYDLAFYGSTGLADRMAKLQSIANQGVNLKCFAGAFGVNLVPHLLDCSAVLNLHGFSSRIFETLRCLRPASMGIPIISEMSSHASVASWEDSGVIFLQDNDFAASVREVLDNRRLLLQASRQLIAFTQDAKWPAVVKQVTAELVDLVHVANSRS